MLIAGSRWKCEVNDPGTKLSMNTEALKSFSVRHTASFEITALGCRKEDIRVSIMGKHIFFFFQFAYHCIN